MSWEFEWVAGPFSFTEGPAWDGEAVLFTDIPNSRIMRYDPKIGKCTIVRTGTNEANGLMFDKDGQLYACEGGGRRMVRYNPDGTTTVIIDKFGGKRLNSPNDLAFDRQGRLWFTDPRYGDKVDDLELDHQSVFRANPQPDGSWKIDRVTYDTTKPNGLLISPDQKWLYVAQSEYGEDKKRELRAYPINDDGSVGQYEVLHNFYPHRGIDGMCLDCSGNIIATAGWQQSGPGPMIYVFAPNGRVLETHPVPVDRPTNCTFGDEDLRTLYVTAGGCLYRARTDRTGYLIYPGLSYIPAEVVADAWDRLMESGPDQVPVMGDQMKNEQLQAMVYLIALNNMSFNATERQLIFFLGLVLWQMMKRSTRQLGTVTREMLLQAEKANGQFLRTIVTDTEADFLSATETMIDEYPEPEVFTFMIRAIFDEDFYAPDDSPIRYEYRGAAFIHLKTVLDAFIESLD